MSDGLSDLPTEIYFRIFPCFSAARDLRALALTCRRLWEIVELEGWRIFVQTRFAPTLSLPDSLPRCYGWPELARALAWQSRCWDRRSFRAEALRIKTSRPLRIGGRRRRGTPTGPVPRVLAARFSPQTGQELLVCGAGDEIEVRRQPMPRSWLWEGGGEDRDARRVKDKWRNVIELGGEKYDDVSDMAIVDAASDCLAVIVGRMKGELAMLSIEPTNFGTTLALFRPTTSDDGGDRQGPRQDTINSLSVLQRVSHHEKSLVAATTHGSVMLYPLPDLEDTPIVEPNIAPSVVCDLGNSDQFRPQGGMRLRRAVWMDAGGRRDGHMLALAMQGTKDPLRYLAITPDGDWTVHSAAKNTDLEAQFGITYETISPKSLLPVKVYRDTTTDLLLSAWHDGTCRLQDLRTPSPFDLVYQDNIDPGSVLGSLVSYGTERFVAGVVDADRVKIFDYRWTKGYYHTAGLPCGESPPFPRPLQPFLQEPPTSRRYRRACDPPRGLHCTWHSLSQQVYYRPNATLLLFTPPENTYRRANGHVMHYHPGIRSMAKACDASPSLFVGTESDIMELSLRDDARDDDDDIEHDLHADISGRNCSRPRGGFITPHGTGRARPRAPYGT